MSGLTDKWNFGDTRTFFCAWAKKLLDYDTGKAATLGMISNFRLLIRTVFEVSHVLKCGHNQAVRYKLPQIKLK